jgi:hypothetical protein
MPCAYRAALLEPEKSVSGFAYLTTASVALSKAGMTVDHLADQRLEPLVIGGTL